MQTQLIPAIRPFSFEQTLTFIARFPPCRGDYVLEDGAITAAVSVAGKPVPFRLRGAGAEIALEVDATPQVTAQVARRAADWIGANDDLGELYAAAEGDPPFRELVRRLHGLHHVRFLTLEEIAVYCVMMQRTPIVMAARMKRAFLERFGTPVITRGHTLRAMPEMDALLELDGAAIGEAIRHARKGQIIAGVVRGVAELGEDFLRAAPYAEARDALLAIDGIGPFSAAAILLRGLGRMEELPGMRHFEDEARAVYGASFDASAIARRYGKHIGYWSFYVKTGAARGIQLRG